MKQRLIAFAALLALAVCALAAATVWLVPQTRQVHYTVAEASGDAAAAEGLHIDLSYDVDGHLLWKTAIDAAAPEQAETTFTFSPLEQDTDPLYQVYSQDSEVFISSPLFTRLDYFRLSNMEDELADLGQTALPADLLALGAGLAPGEEATKVYTLRDYWALFPLSMWLPHSSQNYQELDALAQRTFPIPVPEDLTAETTVTMRLDGSLEVSFSPLSMDYGLSELTDGAVLEDMAYLVFSRDKTELALDYSHFPDGYGIYRISINEETSDHPPRLENFFPLELSTVEAASLEKSPVPGQLLLFTLEAGQLYLTVIDTDSGQALQRLSLPGAALPVAYTGENVLLLLTEEEQAYSLTALALEGRQFSLFLTCPCDETLPGARFLHSAFDGTRLAVADFSRYLGPSFSLWIYGQDGLLYAGQYLSDIATASDPPTPNAAACRWSSH